MSKLVEIQEPFSEEQQKALESITRRACAVLGADINDVLAQGYRGYGDLQDFLSHEIKTLFKHGHISDNDTLEKDVEWLYKDYQTRSGLWCD